MASSNTSATGGFLSPPPGAAPDDDLVLDQQMQALIVGITGLDGKQVRPRWQPDDETTQSRPRNPNVSVNWCAVGVISEEIDGPPAIIHDGTGEGASTLIQHATLDILASFYGPRSGALAALLRDGLYVAQNREFLFHRGMGLIDVGTARRVPDLVNTSVRRRVDLGFRLRRRVERVYAVLNVRQAVGTITGTGGSRDGAVVHTNPLKTPEN